MRHCRILDIFFKAIPVKPWQAFLLRHHMEKCAVCRAKLAGRDEALRALFQAEDFPGGADLWPRIRTRMEESLRPPRAEVRFGTAPLKSVAASALLLAAAGLSILFWRGFKVENVVPTPPAEQKFEVEYVRIGGRPADSYLFQSRDMRMTLIWAEKKSKGGLS